MEKKIILCDTNILIEVYRGNVEIIENLTFIGQGNIAISDVTTGELFFGARDKRELSILKEDVSKLINLPITEEISNMAVELISNYSLSHKLCLPDALIAATALFCKLDLYTLNKKDFLFIENIRFYDVD